MLILPKIFNKKELDLYLIKEKNVYIYFINFHKNKNYKNNHNPFEYHHIIPLYANGPDKKWNLIKLSVANHKIAHELLYLVYKNKEDLIALHFFKNLNNEAYKLPCQLSHEQQRLNKTGFFNSELQSKNGKKEK